jgi:hypothetical protein
MLSKRSRLIMISTIVAILILSVSCTFFVPCTGPLVTKEYSYSGFTAVELGKDITAEITPSNTYGISITLPESLLKHLYVSLSGQTLEVGLDSYFSSGERPKAIITLPDLYTVDLIGGGIGKVSGFKSSHDMSIIATGGSTLEIDIEGSKTDFTVSGGGQMTGHTKFTDATINVSGGSRLELTGVGNNITSLEASGGSQVNLSEISLQDADVTLNGGSQASLWVNDKLNVELHGGSGLHYKGNPQIEKEVLSDFSQLSHD